MKLIITSFAFFLFLNTNAQTIRDTNLVKIGDTVFNSIDVSPSINIGTTGTGNNWNFASLLSNSIDTIIFVDPSTISGGSNFPSATHAFNQDTNMAFAKLSSSSLELLGASVQGANLKYKDPETFVTFPSSYLTTFTDVARIDTTVSGAAIGYPAADSIRAIRVVNITSDFNASGNLTTPFGIFSCIRQHLTRETFDTAYAKTFIGWGLSPVLEQGDTVVSHQYWSDDSKAKFPLVTYNLDQSGTSIDGDLIWINEQSKKTSTISEHSIKNISIFPNPVSSEIALDLNAAIKAVEIIDISGKIVLSFSSTNFKTIDVSSLKNGIYILKIQTDSYLGITKFIKQ